MIAGEFHAKSPFVSGAARADFDQQFGKALRAECFEVLRIQCRIGCHRSSLSFPDHVTLEVAKVQAGEMLFRDSTWQLPQGIPGVTDNIRFRFTPVDGLLIW
jgi:hypothetical protein